MKMRRKFALKFCVRNNSGWETEKAENPGKSRQVIS
jgi:hypothetical protein